MFKIIIFFAFFMMSFQQSIAQNQQNDTLFKVEEFEINDSLTYSMLCNRINFLMKKVLKNEFYHDYHVKIYDISNKKDQKYFAIVGCFVFINACKAGQQVIVVSNLGKKMKILHQLPYLSDEIVCVGESSPNGYKKIILDKRFPGQDHSVRCKISFTKKETITDLWYCVEKPDIPYSIVQGLFETNEKGASLSRIMEMLKLESIKATQNGNIYSIKYRSDIIKYECDLEGIKCKLIQQHKLN
jgi:hypothetical protein